MHLDVNMYLVGKKNWATFTKESILTATVNVTTITIAVSRQAVTIYVNEVFGFHYISIFIISFLFTIFVLICESYFLWSDRIVS